MSLLTCKNIHFVPSIHQRMAFAGEVRRTIDEVRPDCVAVELPRFASEWIVRGALRLPEISVVCYPREGDSGEMFYIPIDPSDSMIEAVRLALEREIEIEWIDTVGAPADPPQMDLPDDLMIERVGLEAYVKTIVEHGPRVEARGEEEAAAVAKRNRAMARNLARIAKGRRRVVCALGLAHFETVRRQVESMEATEAVAPSHDKPKGCFLAHVNPESIPELMREVPRVAYLREVDRDTGGEKGPAAFDKLDALRSILSDAEGTYKEQFKIDLSVTQFKALLQFTRNLALAGGRLQPDSYELVVGAKSSVDGDFGYEVYRLARSYRFQSDESSLPALTLHKGRGTFSDREERFLMRPVFGEPETENVKMRFRLRPPQRLKEIWKEQWDQVDQRGICSWPPEDDRQEKFMTFLRKRALKVVSDDKRQVLEFSTSMLDGLDIRETMRNWHTRKIFVQQAPQPQGRCGAVVVIFADPALDARFSWRCTLYAENQNESDISFYSTPLGAEVVGPRISRTEFGGILSIYPAPQIPDIWRFGLANEFKRCADVLLLAGILFSPDKYIAYVANKPPASQMRSIATHYKKHIIYLPIQGLSVKQLKKVRNFHILNGHDVRSFAADYIFED